MNKSDQLAHTLMTRYADPDQYPYRFWCYPQGFVAWGFIRLWAYTGDARYRDYALRFASQHTTADGEVLGFTGSSMDDMMAGSVLVWAWRETGEDRYRLACDRIRRTFDDYPRTPEGAFWHSRKASGQFWVDGVFMGQMFLTQYGAHIGDAAYCFDEAARQLTLVYDCCHRKNGLLAHAYSADRKAIWADPQTGQSPEVWSEGLGWYALILAETLDVFPADHPKRERLVKQYVELMNGLADVQDPTSGLWSQVVDKPDAPGNWCDTSGSAMFGYSMLRALQMGLVSEDRFAPVVDQAYTGVVSKCRVGTDGLIDVADACDGLCVKTDYDAYIHYPKVDNAKEAVAACLWFLGAYEYRGRDG